MATFQYKAYTAQGVITAGTIVAEGVDSAIDALYVSGLTPFETTESLTNRLIVRALPAPCPNNPMSLSGSANFLNPIILA